MGDDAMAIHGLEDGVQLVGDAAKAGTHLVTEASKDVMKTMKDIAHKVRGKKKVTMNQSEMVKMQVTLEYISILITIGHN